MASWRLGGSFLLYLSAAIGCAGGTRVGAALPAPEPRARLLDAAGAAIWRGDPRAAEAALAVVAERAAGGYDPALDYWSELLALLRCQPLGELPRPMRGPGTAWEQLRRLVQIERVRLARRLAADVPGAASDKAASDKDDKDKKDKKGEAAAPSDAKEAGAVVWPVEDERWPDERLRPVASPDRCLPARSQAAEDRLADGAASAVELPLVHEAAERFGAGHPARPLLLLDEAVLLIAREQERDAVPLLAALAPLPAADGALEAPPPSSALGTLAPQEQVTLAVAAALAAAAAAPADATTVARLRAALAREDLPVPARRMLSLRLADSLRAMGRADEATAVLGPPPHGDDPLGRTLALRQAEAHARAGRRAELLAEARAALAGQPFAAIEEDARLAALRDLALQTLLRSPVGEQTFEALEALGIPAERLRRVEQFATAASMAGVHGSALAALLWLAEEDRNPSRKLHHLARAAVAAARAGDHAQFTRLLGIIDGDSDGGDPAGGAAAAARRPVAGVAVAAVAKAGPEARGGTPRGTSWRGRAGRRPTDWLRALLVVARDSLEALVEAGDQKGLAELVEALHRHLVEGGRGPLDDELTVVYRTATAHLQKGPRAYGERVGQARRPILLGEVALAALPRDEPARLLFVPPEPDSLLFVPRTGTDPGTGGLRRWPAPLGVSFGVASGRAP